MYRYLGKFKFHRFTDNIIFRNIVVHKLVSHSLRHGYNHFLKFINHKTILFVENLLTKQFFALNVVFLNYIYVIVLYYRLPLYFLCLPAFCFFIPVISYCLFVCFLYDQSLRSYGLFVLVTIIYFLINYQSTLGPNTTWEKNTRRGRDGEERKETT